MESYEKMLDEAYKKVKKIESSTDRFEIPKIEGLLEGKNTHEFFPDCGIHKKKAGAFSEIYFERACSIGAEGR